MSKQDETKFKEKVLPELTAIPRTWWVKTQQVSISGTPDILGCVNGIFVALELKAKKGSPSKLQEYNIKLINDCYGFGFVVYPQNWDGILRKIKELADDKFYTRRTK